jgi:hypothetical protein
MIEYESCPQSKDRPPVDKKFVHIVQCQYTPVSKSGCIKNQACASSPISLDGCTKATIAAAPLFKTLDDDHHTSI